MTATWMMQCICIGVLVAVAAWGFESAAKYAGRSLRWIWAGALMLTIVLTLLLPWRTESAIATQFIVTRSPVIAPATHHSLFDRIADFAASVQHSAQSVSHLFASVSHVLASPSRVVATIIDQQPRYSTWISTLWMCATGVVAAVMLWVYASFRDARRLWPIAKLHSIVVRISPSTGPLVVGLANAEIVIPRWLLGRDAHEQQLVLEHEQEHLRAHDPMLLAAACVAVVILPWNPAVWWMLARLRLAVELDCDRRLLNRGINVRSYGALLIDLTGHQSGLRLAMPGFARTTSHLERRLVAMTSKRSRQLLLRSVALSAVGAVALIAACESKLPTSADAAASKTVALKTTEPQVTATTVALDSVAERSSGFDSVLYAKLVAQIKTSKTLKGTQLSEKDSALVGEMRIALKQHLETVQLKAVPGPNANEREIKLVEGRLYSPNAAVKRDTFTIERKKQMELNAVHDERAALLKAKTLQGVPIVRENLMFRDTIPQVLNLKLAQPAGSAVRQVTPPQTDTLMLRRSDGEGPFRITGRSMVNGKSAQMPIMIVDGVRVTEEQLNKIRPDDIEAIQVVKTPPSVVPIETSGRPAGEVRVTTKAVLRKN